MNTGLDKVAIDIALLLPEDINNICFEINQTTNIENYVNFNDGYQPHITLGMGSIMKKDLDVFIFEISKIINSFVISNIIIDNLRSGKYFTFKIRKTQNLMDFHNSIFNVLKKYDTSFVEYSNFFELAENSAIVDWLNNFEINSAYEKYDPHITLGLNNNSKINKEFPIIFKPLSVGIFHLGKHGTCKKKLYEFPIA